MKKLICILLVCGLAAMALVGCGDESKEEKDKEESSAAQTKSTEEATAAPTEAPPVDTYEIKTSFCTLKYPSKWEKKVGVDIDDSDVYTVRFTCGKTKLFDLYFDGGDGDILGTLTTDEKDTVIRTKIYDQNKKAKNYSELNEMVADINVIIECLEQDYDFTRGKKEEKQQADDKVYEIKTSLVTLSYPQKWKDKIEVAVTDNNVHFSSGDYDLFDLYFGENKGDLIGTYDGTEIRIVLHDIEKGEMSDEEYSDLLGMRDDVNVIFDYLSEDEKFEFAS